MYACVTLQALRFAFACSQVAFPSKKHPVMTLKMAKPAAWTHRNHRGLFTEQPLFLARTFVFGLLCCMSCACHAAGHVFLDVS